MIPYSYLYDRELATHAQQRERRKRRKSSTFRRNNHHANWLMNRVNLDLGTGTNEVIASYA